jgi:hypothetical protein
MWNRYGQPVSHCAGTSVGEGEVVPGAEHTVPQNAVAVRLI